MNRAYHGPLWLSISGFGLMIAVVVSCWAFNATRLAYAQSGTTLGLEIRKELEGSLDVQVGQVLEFTIRIRNSGTVSITHLVVEDVFDQNIVDPSKEGIYAEPHDPPLSDPPGKRENNTITWDNIIENLPSKQLGPGEELVIKVRLRAVHPSENLQVVNRAAIKEAIAYDGQKKSNIGGDDANSNVGGSRAPVSKRLATEGVISPGMLVTYTIQIRNEGQVPLLTIPLEDRYHPAALQFVRSVPPPSTNDGATGTLSWSNVLAAMGQEQLVPGDVVNITVVYRVLQFVGEAINNVEVSGAGDKYGNTLTPNQAQAPIRIRPSATDTPTATPTPIVIATTVGTATAQPQSTETSMATHTPFPTALFPTQPAIIPVPSAAPKSGEKKRSKNNDNVSDILATTVVQQPAIAGIATSGTIESTEVGETETPTWTAVPTWTPTPTVSFPEELPNTGRAESRPVIWLFWFKVFW